MRRLLSCVLRTPSGIELRPAPRRSRSLRPAAPDPLEGRTLLSVGMDIRQPAALVMSRRAGLRSPGGREVSTPRRGQADRDAGRAGVIKAISNAPYSPNGSKLDVYLPTSPAPEGGRPVIVAIPGGGWRWADKDNYGGAVAAFAKYGYVVVSIDYAYNSPGGPSTWPANVEDVRAAIRWVRKNAVRLGADPGKVVAMGESAGGHLAALAGVLPDGPVASEGANPAVSVPDPSEVSSRVQAVVDFYGPTDLLTEYRDQPDGRSYLASFLGGSPDRIPGRYEAASPIRHVTPDDPPMYIIQGTADRIVAPDQSSNFASALRDAGVPVELTILPGAAHGFRFRVGGLDLMPQVLAFLDLALNHGPDGS